MQLTSLTPVAANVAPPRQELITAYDKLADVFSSMGEGYKASTGTDVTGAGPHVSSARRQAVEAVSLLQVARDAEPSGGFGHQMLDIAARTVEQADSTFATLEGVAARNDVTSFSKVADAAWKQVEVAWDAAAKVLEYEG